MFQKTGSARGGARTNLSPQPGELLLQARGLQKSFGERTLFEIERLELRDGDRIGLVGANGAGKSTLLSVLAGEDTCDAGTIERGGALAYLRQTGEADGACEQKLLKELAVDRTAGKSGGERTRLAMAAAFSSGAPLLLADEPTTNLDWQGIERLQTMLLDYPGAVVLVSHDRALLDAVCNCVWELENTELRSFPGSYSAWLEQKGRERAYAQFEYDAYRAEKRRLEAETRALGEQARTIRHTPKRMGNSEARLHKGSHVSQEKVQNRVKSMQSRVSRLEEKQRPADLPDVRMTLVTDPPPVSRTAARVRDLTVRYGDRTVLNRASFELPTGTRTVMLGDNGAGKSTAVKHLAEGGDGVWLAGGVRLGYFAQDHAILDPEQSVLENVRESSALAEGDIRTILANLCLEKRNVFQPVGALSGGERAKAAFAKLIASGCNLLVLDEPTNHLDLYTAEALERMLLAWEGTLLVITHDRRLTQRLAQRLLFVEGGAIRTFEGDWPTYETSLRPRPADGMEALMEQMRRAAEAGKQTADGKRGGTSRL